MSDKPREQRNTERLDQVYYDEYTSHDAILKYTKSTAGHGVSYLLDHDYKDIYLRALSHLPAGATDQGLRMLEFGCGGGMNIIHLLTLLRRHGIRVAQAVGSDFSPVLIEAAIRDSKSYLAPDDQAKVSFHVATNETLVEDIAAATGVGPRTLAESFDFVFGVNTMRYSHRDGREIKAVQSIWDLLKPGGVCVNIDMNNRFPLFRSAVKNMFRINKRVEAYIPSLEEYVSPFEKAGFEILRTEHFCWIPHSGSKLMLGVMRGLTPLLDAAAKSRAMRSLVVARKPTGTR